MDPSVKVAERGSPYQGSREGDAEAATQEGGLLARTRQGLASATRPGHCHRKGQE